jgi:15-cis-phytoene synthase
LSADGELDSSVRRADPDRWLASRFIGDIQARADVVAIYAYDHELDRAGRVTSNALLAEIRLTWWREVLDEMYAGGFVRRHPVAQGLADAIRRRGHPREPFEAMIDARIEPFGDPIRWADAVGGSATWLAARTLDPFVDRTAVSLAGRVWGLVMLRRSGRDAIDVAGSLSEAARAARRVSAAAFPAIACATLARAEEPSPLETRLRLLMAMLWGRL